MKVKPPLRLLGAKVPGALIKRLDKAAKAAGRSRSSELRVRLERSLSEQPNVPDVQA